MRLLSRFSAIGAITLATTLASAAGCAHGTQTYTMLAPAPNVPAGQAAASLRSLAGPGAPIDASLGSPEARGDSTLASRGTRGDSTLASRGARGDRPAAAAAAWTGPSARVDLVGSLSVERIQGGQSVLTVQLNQLPPPERIAPGLRAFVVWLEDPRGRKLKVGTLHYDRAHHSGNLLATTGLAAFTVRVTGERDDRTSSPSGVLLAERRVVPN